MQRLRRPNSTYIRRPLLRGVQLRDVWPPKPGAFYVTISRRQWAALLHVAYDRDCVLPLEVDAEERVVDAYRRRPVDRN
jgi:hypothetical protein